MRNKVNHEYFCLNGYNKKLLKDSALEDLLDTQDRKNAPLRTENVRKSIEHYLERQRLKRHIADFDWYDQEDLQEEF